MSLTVLHSQNLIRQIMGLDVRFFRMGKEIFGITFFFLVEVEINMEAAKAQQSHIFSFYLCLCVSSCVGLEPVHTKPDFI